MAENVNNDTIVIVDDEEIVLSSLKSILNLETDYNVVSFLSPIEALKYIEDNEVSIVISDYYMEKMDGITLLARVREMKPYIPRIILTGYADKENAIKAINEVGLFQYIEKPWNNDDLLIILRNGLEKQKLMRKLEEKLNEISKAHSDLQSIQDEIVKTFV